MVRSTCWKRQAPAALVRRKNSGWSAAAGQKISGVGAWKASCHCWRKVWAAASRARASGVEVGADCGVGAGVKSAEGSEAGSACSGAHPAPRSASAASQRPLKRVVRRVGAGLGLQDGVGRMVKRISPRPAKNGRKFLLTGALGVALRHSSPDLQPPQTARSDPQAARSCLPSNRVLRASGRQMRRCGS